MKKSAPKHRLERTNLGAEVEERTMSPEIGHIVLITELTVIVPITVCQGLVNKNQWAETMTKGMHTGIEGIYPKGNKSKRLDIEKWNISKGGQRNGKNLGRPWDARRQRRKPRVDAENDPIKEINTKIGGSPCWKGVQKAQKNYFREANNPHDQLFG